MYLCTSFHAGRDFNDTVIVTEIPVAQRQVMQAIQIFDDEINEGQENFNVSLEVLGNISNAVEFRIQTTLCRIRQSDRKLICMYHVHISVFCLSAHKLLFKKHCSRHTLPIELSFLFFHAAINVDVQSTLCLSNLCNIGWGEPERAPH